MRKVSKWFNTDDRCSYIVSLGILDKLSEYLTNVHGPIDENTSAVEFVQHAVSLVTAVVRVTSRRSVHSVMRV